jgi:hypothetical protein
MEREEMEVNKEAKRLLLGQKCENCKYFCILSDKKKDDNICFLTGNSVKNDGWCESFTVGKTLLSLME